MHPKRKIVAVTGARSDYDLLYSVYNRLQSDERFDFSIIVTGPHLSEKYGLTAQYISQDGFHVADTIYNLIDSDKKIGRAMSIGVQIPQLCQAFNRLQPDIVTVAGDREEAISVSMTAAYMDIPVAHFFGGDIAKDGNIDNSVRYAASKFAHLHFPTLPQHRETLLRLGEDDWRIHVSGNPALDRFLAAEWMEKEQVFAHLNADIGDHVPYVVLIQHSIITEAGQQGKDIRATLDAIHNAGVRCFVNYPNSDAGNHAIITAYQEYAARYPKTFVLFQNLSRIYFINLLRHAACLVGNSSAGILEAPSLHLPVVNVGSRQRGRIHGDNVIFTDNDSAAILTALRTALSDQDFIARVKAGTNPYGDGRSAEKIVETLATVSLDNTLIHKNITY